MLIRRASRSRDGDAIWSVIGPTIRAAETYALDPDMSEAEALDYWLGPDKDTFVADDDGTIVGTYYLRENQAGGGKHVCNCGYMTHSTAQGRGIGRRMCAHSLVVARQRGFRAMQFNFVVRTNESAVQLWHAMGFVVVGTLPSAFRHPRHEWVDALVMFQTL